MTKLGNGWRFIVIMARRFQFADGLKLYEESTAVSNGVAQKTQIKVEGLVGNASRAIGVRKKGRQSKKS